jgi:xanthine dehydrogenase accessory factor
MGAPSTREFADQLHSRISAGQPVVLATVVATEGSASARAGAKMLLDARGERIFGWGGGGCAESEVRAAALECLRTRQPVLLRLDLDDEVLGVGMPCGGYLQVYVEPLLPEPRVLILGHGLIAETVARMAHQLEMHVTVNDALATEQSFPDAEVRITEDPAYAKVECGPDTYVVITTQHRSDHEALCAVLPQDPAYVALVASRKRSALILERMQEEGFSADALRRVSAPAGLDLGACTPQEIGLSIVAEVVALRRGVAQPGRRLVDVKGVRVTEAGVEIPEGPLRTESCPS